MTRFRLAIAAALIGLLGSAAMWAPPSASAAAKATKRKKPAKPATTKPLKQSTPSTPVDPATTTTATTTTTALTAPATTTTTTIPFVPAEDAVAMMKRFGITLADIQVLFNPSRMFVSSTDTNFQLRADVKSNFWTNALNLGCNIQPPLTGTPTNLTVNAYMFRGGVMRLSPVRVQGEFNTVKGPFNVCNITLDLGGNPRNDIQAVIEPFLNKIAENAA